MMLLVEYVWAVIVCLTAMSVIPAAYVIVLCGIDAFTYDPWLDGPADGPKARWRISRSALVP